MSRVFRTVGTMGIGLVPLYTVSALGVHEVSIESEAGGSHSGRDEKPTSLHDPWLSLVPIFATGLLITAELMGM